MSMPWFRVYRELKDDPKIGALDDACFRLFIESMCWACEAGNGGGTGLTVDNANWAFRRNVTETLQKLLDCSVLRLSETGEICVTKWKDRQMTSDSSTERVRKYREKKQETFQKRPLKRYTAVLEQNRTDKNRTEVQPVSDVHETTAAELRREVEKKAEEVYKLYPRKVGRPEALRAIIKASEKHGFEHLTARTKLFAESRVGEDPNFTPHPSTWFNQERYNDDPATWKRTQPSLLQPQRPRSSIEPPMPLRARSTIE